MESTTKQQVVGTHRVREASDTLQWVLPKLPAYGISRLADITWLDDIGIPTYQAVRPSSRSLSVSQGKGITPELAKCSALMESIELWHAERVEPSREQTVGEAQRMVDYDFRDLLRDEHQLNPDMTLKWVAATDLLDSSEQLVPWSYVSMDSRPGKSLAIRGLKTTTNGLSSGNTTEEAALHGLLEVAERHQLATSSRRRGGLAARIIDPLSVDSSNAALIEKFRQAGAFVEIYDCTDSEIGLATFASRVWSPGFPLTMSGAGCHLDPAIALSRSLTEAAQARLTLIAGAREDLNPRVWDLLADPAVYQQPLNGKATVDFRTVASTVPISWSIEKDLTNVSSRISSALNTRILVVNLSNIKDQDGVPVVKVIVPKSEFSDGV